MSKDLLKLIETVNPDDTAMLDEIDARVDCYLKKINPDELWLHGGKRRPAHLDNHFRKTLYTRSRDLLKKIRPEGWSVDTVSALKDDCLYFDAIIWKIGEVLKGRLLTTKGGFLPTEELAELHAIIQAIQWERDNNE